jgi:hypothetical protein
MTESEYAQHIRLLNRTADLKHEHAELDLARTPFNQADHDAHRAHLQQHQAELAAHQERERNESSDGRPRD